MHLHAEGLAAHLPAESQSLQVKEPSCSLAVGERCRIGAGQLIELPPGGDLKPQCLYELRVVTLKDTEEVSHLAVDVVDNLPPRGR